MECHRCGKQYESEAGYCSDCGSKLIDRPAASESAAYISKPTDQISENRNKGGISEFLFQLFGVLSIIGLLISTVIALYLSVDTCDRFLLICEEDFQTLGWWWLGALLAILTLISFFVFHARAGRTTKKHIALLLMVILVAIGSCVNNINQTMDRVVNYEQNVDIARQDSCAELLQSALDQINNAPDSLNHIMNLARIQISPCRDFESAHQNYEKLVELYESKQETTREEKHAYLDALNGLINSPLEGNKFSREINEKCPDYHNLVNTVNWTEEESKAYYEKRDEYEKTCIMPLVDEFEKKMDLKREKYQFKIDNVLNSWDE